MAKKEGIEKDRILPCGRKGGISKMKLPETILPSYKETSG
jgi:hypothetical protein